MLNPAAVRQDFLFAKFQHIIFINIYRKEEKKWQNYILDTEQWAALKQQMH